MNYISHLLLFIGKPANSNPARHSRSPVAMNGPDSGRNSNFHLSLPFIIICIVIDLFENSN